jgi:hypothetical protein
MSFNFVLVLALVVQLAFAGAPYVCGDTGATTLEGTGPETGQPSVCDFNFLCKLNCPCPTYVRFVNVQSTSTYSSFAAAWMSQCHGRLEKTLCQCENFYHSIGTSAKDINDAKNSICNCPTKLKTSPKSTSSKKMRAQSLEIRASELEQKALELESQAESLELE